MRKSKLLDKQAKIEQTVTDGYKTIEKAAVTGYHKVENGVVGTYSKVEDWFVDRYLIHEGETLEEAKARLRAEQQTQGEKK